MTKNVHIIILVMGICVSAVFALLLYFENPFFDAVENRLIDLRFMIRGTVPPPDTVVIAALDEASIERFGRWPWSRDKIASLIRVLTDQGAEIIMPDIIFSETEENDRILSAAMNDAGNVILPLVFDFERSDDSPYPLERLHDSYYLNVENLPWFRNYPPIHAKGLKPPVDALIDVAMAFGHINMLADSDGTLRWEPMAIEYSSHLFPSIDLRIASHYLGVPTDRIQYEAGRGITLGNKGFIPLNRWGQMLIHYYGPSQTFPHLSIAGILDGTVAREQIYGKIVLIGATGARGIFDLRVTPFSAEMPGIEKHANVVASILDQRFLRQIPKKINILLVIASGILISIVTSRVKALGAALFLIVTLAAYFVTGYYLFAVRGLVVNLVYPATNIILIVMAGTAYSYAIEERHARQIRKMFSDYVTSRVVDELIKNPAMANLGGERRELSILFSDIRGFTSLSEKLSPEEVVSLLNEYLTAMTEVVFRWEGTLDKFIGDAIMAFWSAPLRQDDHAERAVRCAIHMVARLEQLKRKWQEEGKPVLQIGIGINTGEVLVGNIGASGKKMDYTAIGDHVNLASRVESLNKKYDSTILITEHTLDKIRDLIRQNKFGHICVTGLDKVIVKGKEKPVVIYQLALLEEGGCVVKELEEKEAVKLTDK